MNVSFFIAKRYFFSKKKQNFINLISYISMIGVAVGTMALIIVLSVFNGMEALTVSLYSSHHSELKMSPKTGKSFEVNEAFLAEIRSVEGVNLITEVIEDNALLRYREAQTAVSIKGVSGNFTQQYDLESHLTEGEFMLESGKRAYALIGEGIRHMLSVSVFDEMEPMVFWYPKKGTKISSDPMSQFRRRAIVPVGVLSVELQFDNNTVIVPIEFTEELMAYKNHRTSLELKTDNPDRILDVREALKNKFGERFDILTIEEQQEDILRAVKIERLFVFGAFSFILAIASFNIFFSLAMLVLEKRKDLAVLQSLGTPKSTIKKIFLMEGALIAFTGAFIGLSAGFLICWLQQEYGIIELGVRTSKIRAYPVQIVWADFLYIGLTMTLITLGASILPAVNAAKVSISENI